MDKSDAIGIVVSLAIAGAFIYAYEKGYIKIPGIQTTVQTTVTTQPTSSTSTTTTSTSSTTTTTTYSQSGTVSGTVYVGTGSSVQTDPYTVTTPSSSTSTTTTSSTSTTSSSTSTSSSSSTSTTTTSSTSTTSSSTSSTSTSGYAYQTTSSTSGCATPTTCPSFLTGGQCYQVACDCFSTYTCSINNNYGQPVPIEISTEFVSYCNMTQGITWDTGYIQPGEWSMSLPYAPSNASVGGAIYVWAPGKQYPYVLDYVAVNGNNILALTEVDLAPTTGVTVTNKSPYTIILQLVSDLFEKNEVQIPPGGSGSIQVGNGWQFSVGTVDLYGNFPSSNPAPVSCFVNFILAGGQPAINFINDQNYQECSQWAFTMQVGNQTYYGNLGQGLTNNVYTVSTSSTSSTSSSTSTSSSSSTSTCSTTTTLYGGYKPKMIA